MLFDFDGTIMDTNGIIIGSWQHTFLAVEGEKRPESEIVKTFGEPLVETMEMFFPYEDVAEMVAIYRTFQRNVDDGSIHMFPGVGDLIQTLKEEGYKLGIVTSRLWSATSTSKYNFDVAHLFDAIVSAEDTDVHKPDPLPCLLCLEKLGLSPEEAVFVGDTKFDVLCARNAGVKSVMVGWSLAADTSADAGIYRPDYVIEKSSELLDILRIENSK